jgi:GNAT superfamily N-acetyltransferase
MEPPTCDTGDFAGADSHREPSGSPDRAIERVTLRDGSAVMIRPLERDDVALVQAIFEQMGEEARYRRFLGYKKRLSPRDLDALTDVDHHDREALVALDAEFGAAVGVARMIRQATRPDAAEASVAVVDAWQGRGLGTVLMDRLVLRARAKGVHLFTAVLLTRNRAMLHLFEHIGAVRVTFRSIDTLELEVEMPFETDAPRAVLRAAAGGDVHQ